MYISALQLKILAEMSYSNISMEHYVTRNDITERMYLLHYSKRESKAAIVGEVLPFKAGLGKRNCVWQ
jgi:hypothetical protein